MKKLCILMAIVVLCTLLFSSCNKNEGNNTTKTTETSAVGETEQTTLSAEQLAVEEKDAENAKKCLETLLLSKNPQEIKKVIRNGDDEYIQDVIEGFPYDDYIITVKKLGEHKGNLIYYVEVERASEGEGDEYYFDGIQIFARSENGLLIELDTTIENEIISKFHCRSCEGSGSMGYDEVHKVEYKCDVCKGTGFVF